MTLAIALDLAGAVSAFAAAWLWLLASGRQVRRISLNETIDAADLNRIVVAMNRAALLNRRAALAATVSALSVSLRFAIDLLPP